MFNILPALVLLILTDKTKGVVRGRDRTAIGGIRTLPAVPGDLKLANLTAEEPMMIGPPGRQLSQDYILPGQPLPPGVNPIPVEPYDVFQVPRVQELMKSGVPWSETNLAGGVITHNYSPLPPGTYQSSTGPVVVP